MGHGHRSNQLAGTSFFRLQLFQWAATAALIFLAVSPCVSQKKPAPPAARSGNQSARPGPKTGPTTPPEKGDWTKQLDKYPGLGDEFARLLGRFQTEVQFPAARRQSRLLPLLPESTAFYGAFPNYGETAHQALQIFRQELEQSAVLREWWQKEAGEDGRKFEDAVDKFYQLSQYLGDEAVLSSPMSDKGNRVLFLAEVKKPGLQTVLQQFGNDLKEKSGSPMRIFTPEQLAAAKEDNSLQEPVALVRPDLLAIAFDFSVLRGLNAQLNQGAGKFASAPFGQRLLQSYEGGTKILLGADLQKVLSKVPISNPQEEAVFRLTGFSDLKYFISEYKEEAPGQAASQTELTFTAPRHGVASWLASAGPLSGLDFVSPKASMVAEILLKSPALIFDDVADLVNATQPNGLAALTQMEQGLNFSLRDDVLRRLTGEITLELVNPGQSEPKLKILLGTNDAAGLQNTVNGVLASMGIKAKPIAEGGLTSYSVPIPGSKEPDEIDFAFAEGYLMIAPSRAILTDALRIHKSGESLGKSREFLASLPGGPSTNASALTYQNLGPMMSVFLQQASPEMAKILKQFDEAGGPTIMRVMGNETSIKAANNSAKFDVATTLIVAAVAIPNLLRSKMAANESAAVSTVRTVNTAQATYATIYPARGYAASLATLGPGSSADCRSSKVTEANACLLDSKLGGASCTPGQWCTKGAFRYSVTAVCKKQRCDDFVVVATPVDTSHGTKSFCSTSDAVIRSKTGPPLMSPVTVTECIAWSPVH